MPYHLIRNPRPINFDRRRLLSGVATAAATGAALALTPVVARAQDQLDTDTGGFPLDDAARALLGWWTPPAGLIRGYVGGAGRQMHVRTMQPARPQFRPVFLLHEAGVSGRVWDRALAELGKTRTALAPDLPAHGDSDGDPLMSVEGLAAAVLGVMDDVSLKKIDIVGDGLGAHVALLLAAMAPHRVGRLVLSGIGASRIVASPRPDPANTEDPSFLTKEWAAFRADYPADAPLGVLDRDFADLLRTRAAPPRDRGVLSLAATITHETLVVRADTDRGAEDLARSLPKGSLSAGAAWTRDTATRAPGAWAAAVTAFLDLDKGADTPRAVTLPDVPPTPGALMRRFMPTPDGQLHYRIIAAADGGRAPPLLCFHMSPRSGAYYESLMAALAVAGRTMIAVDSAGYGESFKPQAWLNVPGYAGCMANFIDALGIANVDVLGDHTGAKIAIETARQRPRAVRRIVMSTAGVYSPEEQRGWQRRMDAIAVTADGGHYAALWTRYHTLNRGKLDSAQNAFRFYETVRAGPCMWWGPRAANLYILGDVLPTIPQQILLVCSDEDSLIEPSRRGAPLIKNGRYVEFAKQGNSMVEYRAAAVAPTIAAFLAE